jgi:hypothetical protein
MTRKIVSIMVLILLLFAGGAYSSEMFGAKGAQQTNDPTLQQMLTYAIQDEYLARAEYELIIQKYGSERPFSNIIQSEGTHIGMLVTLFEKYGFPVPENTASKYVVLPKGLKESFETGVQAEIENIAMYEKFLEKELPDDVRAVFQRLKDGSGNHLSAFQNGLNRYK